MLQAESKTTSKCGMGVLDFIGSTFTAATLAWAVALAAQAIGFDPAVWVAFVVTALLFSALAFSSLIVGGIVWAARHVRIVII